jgi:hypothetical protein
MLVHNLKLLAWKDNTKASGRLLALKSEPRP